MVLGSLTPVLGGRAGDTLARAWDGATAGLGISAWVSLGNLLPTSLPSVSADSAEAEGSSRAARAGEDASPATLGPSEEPIPRPCRALTPALLPRPGYRHWHADLRPDDSPLEAGLAFTCKLKSAVPFLGRAALEKQRAEGLRRRLLCLTVDE